jgi:hypothetical protein
MSAHALPNRYVVTDQGEWSTVLPASEAWSPTAEDVEAVGLLAFLTGWGGGVAPVYRDGSAVASGWVDCSQPSETATDLLRRIARGRDSTQLELGLPERQRGIGGPGECTVLWCWVES